MSKEKEVIKYLKKVGSATGNKIAQEALGLIKATGGSGKLIQEMVDAGQLEIDSSGRYTEYRVASSGGATISKSKSKAKKSSKKSSKKYQNKHARKIETETVKESALPTVDLPGYSAKLGKGGVVKITGPNRQVAQLREGEHLVVINGNFAYAAATPPEVIAAISDYAKDQGMATFTVSDVKTNSVIGTDKDIQLDESRIICLEIKKHNKAA
jgi:hypothetical protein